MVTESQLYPTFACNGFSSLKIRISQRIRCGNTVESEKLRESETILGALAINCEDMRMLSAQTGDKLRAVSEVARKGRRVKDLRRLMNRPDLWMKHTSTSRETKEPSQEVRPKQPWTATHQNGPLTSSNSFGNNNTSQTRYEK